MHSFKKLNLQTLITFSLILGLLFTAFRLKHAHQLPQLNVSKQDLAINFKNDFLKIFSTGQKRLISDIFWIKTLLDSDHEHYHKTDLNSWMYMRFNTIAELDPKFKLNYLFGGQYLAIVKDDILGANDILIKGLTSYPDDAELLKLLAYNYTFELKDYVNGDKYYSRLLETGEAPEFVNSLITKIRYETHPDLNEAKSSLEDILSTLKPESMSARKIQHDLINITIELDLQCLNNKEQSCNRVDPHGTPYRYIDGQYISPEGFVPYKLHTRN